MQIHKTFIGALTIAPAANAQDTVKVGLIMAYSGQFADTAAQIDNGIKLYMKQNGDAVAGKKIELIRKDTGGPNPDVAKRLAQELVVRDGVDILAGFTLTPEALAAADVSAEAKKFMVIMNAATSIITTKSEFSTRTSMTLPMIADSAGKWAIKAGIEKAYTMVSDFGPGHDAERAAGEDGHGAEHDEEEGVAAGEPETSERVPGHPGEERLAQGDARGHDCAVEEEPRERSGVPGSDVIAPLEVNGEQ